MMSAEKKHKVLKTLKCSYYKIFSQNASSERKPSLQGEVPENTAEAMIRLKATCTQRKGGDSWLLTKHSSFQTEFWKL